MTGLNWLLHRLQLALFSPFVRIVNYHDVPPSQAEGFERQLLFYKRHFVSVDRQGLLDLQAGRWPHDRPGILITFDDAYKSQAQVAAPLLEKHGFVGWFFVPTDFIDVPRDQQKQYGYDHALLWSDRPGEDLGAMSWEDIRRLDRMHVIGCHTSTHCRLSAKLTEEQLSLEIRQSKRRLEQELGHEVDVFCWVGGEEWSYSASAAKAIRDAGYRISFMNARFVVRPGNDLLQLHRNNVESYHPVWYVRYLFSGLLDARWIPRRRRVKALTSA